MAAAGPFETAPRLAVAVSGGPDSMALCLLADRWARARGGYVVAMIVDHGLRPASRGEAERAGRWLSARGVAVEILVWSGDKPRAGVAARARQARYRLLADRCRERGLLHLLVAHHQDDQAETLLLRAARGSGPTGFAAMSPLVETGSVRVIRPLLGVAKRRLRAHLEALGQPWIEDPSNADPASARVRARLALAGLPAPARSRAALADTAAGFAALRAGRDRAAVALLVRCCRLHPQGFALLDAGPLLAATAPVAAAALGRVAAAVGGTAYPPPADKLDRLLRRLAAETPAVSLGRCTWRLGRNAGRGPGVLAAAILVVREARALPPPMAVASPDSLEWDGRFDVRIEPAQPSRPALRLEALGGRGWSEANRLVPGLRDGPVPRAAAITLPALWDDRALLAVPGLGLCLEPAAVLVTARFRPRRSLSGTGYYLA